MSARGRERFEAALKRRAGGSVRDDTDARGDPIAGDPASSSAATASGGVGSSSWTPEDDLLAGACRDWLDREAPDRHGSWIVEGPAQGTDREAAFQVRREDTEERGILYHPRIGRRRTADERGHWLRAAGAAGRVIHPRLVRVLECGETDGLPWRVEEGGVGNESGAAATRGPMDPTRAAEIVLAAAEGVARAHALGVVHGAIDVAAIRWDSERGARLAGLGGSWLADEGAPVAGPPTAADDRFALGALLYRLLTGAEVCPGRRAGEIRGRESMLRPPLPRDLDGRIPAPLEAVALTALRLNGSASYADAAEMADDLRRWLGGVESRLEGPRGRGRVLYRLRRDRLVWACACGAVAGLLILLAAWGAAWIGEARADARVRDRLERAATDPNATPEALARLEPALEALADRDGPGSRAARLLTRLRLRRAEGLEAAGRAAEAGALYRLLLLEDPGHPAAHARRPPPAGRSALVFHHPPAGAELILFGPHRPGTGYVQDPAPERRGVADGVRIPLVPGRYLAALLVEGRLDRIFDVPVGNDGGTELDLAVIPVSAHPMSKFRRIEDALAQARPGNVIEIDDGLYEETVRVRTPNLTLRARAGARPVISGVRRSTTLVAEDCPGLMLDGLEVRNGQGAGARLIRCDRAWVRHCVFAENSEAGLSVMQSGNVLVDAVSAVQNGGTGIELEECARATVNASQVRSCRRGLGARDCPDLQAVRNVLWQCEETGIRLERGCARALVYGNQIAGGASALEVEGGVDIRVIGNGCRWQTAGGVRARGERLVIRDNAVWNERRPDAWGLDVGGAQVTVANNLISGGGRGLRLDAVLATVRRNVFHHVQGPDLVFDALVHECDENLFWPDHRIGSILGNDLGVDLDTWRGLTALANEGRPLDGASRAADPRVEPTESGGARFAADGPCRLGLAEDRRLGPVGERAEPFHFPIDDALRGLLDED